jgi:Cof subfamily protein (haloacid dehalogenase superfamily)
VTDRPRLVASDLDGTLLRSDGTVSARSVDVWNALPDHGIETVIVTARPPRWLHDLAHVVGPSGIALCGNGAFVYEVATRRMVDTHCFDTDVLNEIVADLRHGIPGIAFAAERTSGPFIETGYPDPHRDSGADRVVIGGVERLAEEPVGKLLALAPGIPTEPFLALVEQVVGERAHLAYSGAHGLAELNPIGVTKATALARWCAGLGIDAADVWAFGDMPNDLPMLHWAGRGYAVANAHPDVAAAAGHRCGSNDEDGVVHTLARFVNGLSLDH